MTRQEKEAVKAVIKVFSGTDLSTKDIILTVKKISTIAALNELGLAGIRAADAGKQLRESIEKLDEKLNETH